RRPAIVGTSCFYIIITQANRLLTIIHFVTGIAIAIHGEIEAFPGNSGVDAIIGLGLIRSHKDPIEVVDDPILVHIPIDKVTGLGASHAWRSVYFILRFENANHIINPEAADFITFHCIGYYFTIAQAATAKK